jgi:hypothetical protein
MTGAGQHAIDPASKAADRAAAGHLFDRLEECRIIGEEFEGARQ